MELSPLVTAPKDNRLLVSLENLLSFRRINFNCAAIVLFLRNGADSNRWNFHQRKEIGVVDAEGVLQAPRQDQSMISGAPFMMIATQHNGFLVFLGSEAEVRAR